MAYGRKAEDYLERGQFQRAVQAYDEIGDKVNLQIASLACAQDCLEVGLYERAIEYFELGNREEIGNELKKILNDNKPVIERTYHYSPGYTININGGIGFSFLLGTSHPDKHFKEEQVSSKRIINTKIIEPTSNGLESRTHNGCFSGFVPKNSIDYFVGSESENFLRLVQYVQEQDFIGKAEELKK